MQAVTTVGLDIAKSVFQVHGVEAEGDVLIRRKLKRITSWRSSRRPPCLVGLRPALHRIGHEANMRFVQDARAAELPDASSHPSTVYPRADLGDQCHPCSHGRVRDRSPRGGKGIEHLLGIVTDSSDQSVPEVARACLAALGAQLRMADPGVRPPDPSLAPIQ